MRSVSVTYFASVFMANSEAGPQFKRSGISGKGKNIVTKHDPEICGRKNARKVMENV